MHEDLEIDPPIEKGFLLKKPFQAKIESRVESQKFKTYSRKNIFWTGGTNYDS